jgi:uncharacterized protein
MLSRNVVLLTLDAFGGATPGKTLLQKRMFFLGEILNKNFGYRPHYYGPYSDDIAADITILTNYGFLETKTCEYGMAGGGGFEVRRFDYRLTEEGKKAVQWLKGEYPEEAKGIETAALRIENAGEMHYMDLSIAAKAYFILKKNQQRALAPEEIAVEAKKFSWSVEEPQINSAVGFLEKLGMVTTAASS